VEIDRLELLRAVLATPHAPLSGLRLQDLDLHTVEPELLDRTDLTDLVVLGGRLSPALTDHLVRHGAIVFPSDPKAPLDVYRSRLYTADELYAGLADGYAGTPDGRAYEWTLDHAAGADAYATMLRAIHDESITDALDEVLRGRRVVGVMGGHQAQRGSIVYAAAARLGLTLADAGLVVLTGGGPGAMEAANLGAYAAYPSGLDRALRTLAEAPSFVPNVSAWATAGFAAREALGVRGADDPLRSVGIPTWFYGHEPPNVFGQLIAKYFSNALREDQLLARCTAGIVALPGAAGTVQEIFQVSTRLFYERMGVGDALLALREPLPPLVLVGVEHWTRTLPAWPLLQTLGAGRPMGRALHLVDTVEQAARVITGR